MKTFLWFLLIVAASFLLNQVSAVFLGDNPLNIISCLIVPFITRRSKKPELRKAGTIALVLFSLLGLLVFANVILPERSN